MHWEQREDKVTTKHIYCSWQMKDVYACMARYGVVVYLTFCVIELSLHNGNVAIEIQTYDGQNCRRSWNCFV